MVINILINKNKKILSEGFKSAVNGCIEYSFEPMVTLENGDTVSGGRVCL